MIETTEQERKKKALETIEQFLSGEFLKNKEFIILNQKTSTEMTFRGSHYNDFNMDAEEYLKDKDETGLTLADVDFESVNGPELFATWMHWQGNNIEDTNVSYLQNWIEKDNGNLRGKFHQSEEISSFLEDVIVKNYERDGGEENRSHKEPKFDDLSKGILCALIDELKIINREEFNQDIEAVQKYNDSFGFTHQEPQEQMGGPQPDFGEQPPFMDYQDMPDYDERADDDMSGVSFMPFDEQPNFAPSDIPVPPGENSNNSQAPRRQAPKAQTRQNGNQQEGAGAPFHIQEQALNRSSDKREPGKLSNDIVEDLKRQLEQQGKHVPVEMSPFGALASGIGKGIGASVGFAREMFGAATNKSGISSPVGSRDERPNPADIIATRDKDMSSICGDISSQLKGMSSDFEVVSNHTAPLEDRMSAVDNFNKKIDEISDMQAEIESSKLESKDKDAIQKLYKEKDDLVSKMNGVKDDPNTDEDLKKKIEKLIEAIKNFFDMFKKSKSPQNSSGEPSVSPS